MVNIKESKYLIDTCKSCSMPIVFTKIGKNKEIRGWKNIIKIKCIYEKSISFFKFHGSKYNSIHSSHT